MSTLEGTPSVVWWVPGAIFLALAIVLVLGGWAYFDVEAEDIRATSLAELAAIGDLKVDQVKAWRADRERDGAAIQADPLLREEIDRFLKSPDDPALTQRLRLWAEGFARATDSQYVRFVTRSRTLLTVGSAPDSPDDPDPTLLHQVFTAGSPILSDLHQTRPGKIHLDLLAPILGQPEALGEGDVVLIVGISPDEYLFPLIQSWPTPSPSSETLLVRREGDEVVYLNELRHRPAAALSLRIPLSRTRLLATQALLGRTGFVEGEDYRGEEVIGAVRSIPGSSWFLVAKVNTAELFAPIRSRAGQMLGLTTIAVLLAGALVLLAVRHRQAGLFRRLYRAEAEGRSLAERYALISRRANDIILLLRADGSILEANDRAIETYGYSREELVGLDMRRLRPPSDGDEVANLMQLVRDQGGANLETTHVRKDGSAFPVEVSIGLARSDQTEAFIGVVRDISHRKAAEDALAAEKERLAVTLRSIGDGVIATDISGNVTLMNRMAERLTGWPWEEAKGRALREIFHIINSRTREPSDNPVDKVLASGQAHGLANHTALIARGGQELTIADSGAPIRDRESRIVGVVLVFRDVTTEEKIEENLARAQKLESIAVLAGGIAHDFNNLLTGIMGNVSLARLKSSAPAERDECLAEAEAASARARELTQQLLTFSRGGAPVKKLANVEKVVGDAAQFASRGASAVCRVELNPGLWPAEVDTGQLAQVFNNLVINALQAMPGGGTITLHAENIALDGDNPYLLPSGSFVRVSVKDQGTGIAEDLLPRIFDPYFTTKQKGSGLGLAICHSIVKKHSGHINVTSTLGQGTTFEVFLPASPGRVTSEPGTPRRAFPAGTGRILVMDDEQAIRRLVTRLLGTLGYESTDAREGAEALGLYRAAMEAGVPFQAVIADLTVAGGMGGREMAERILALDPNARIIVSSGYANDPILATFRDHGFRGVLAKPYRIDDLHTALQLLLAPRAAGEPN